MTNDRLKAIKDSMVVVCDSREQRNMHLLEALNKKSVKFEQDTLKYGDYSFRVGDIDFRNKIIFERKASLSEIASNFMGKNRMRFDTEFQKAKNDGCKIVLLIEDPEGRAKIKLRQELDKSIEKDWNFIKRKTWNSEFCANAMIASIKAFKERYSLDVIFCKKTDTADKMLEIFYKAIDNYFGDKE